MKAEFSAKSWGYCLGGVSSWFHTTYLVLGLTSETVTVKAVLAPQLLPALLAGHQHIHQRTIVCRDSDLPDELLYGRAGYLYALLYVNTEIGPGAVCESAIKEVLWGRGLGSPLLSIRQPVC